MIRARYRGQYPTRVSTVYTIQGRIHVRLNNGLTFRIRLTDIALASQFVFRMPRLGDDITIYSKSQFYLVERTF